MPSEKKRTAINLLAKILSYGTSILVSFFLTPYLVGKIGKEAYSFYPLANNFVNYMSVFTIALNSMASRFITISLTKGDKRKANTYFVSILYGNILMSIVLFVPLVLVVVFLERILDIPFPLVASVKLLFALVFISMAVNLLTNVYGVAVFSQNRLDLGAISDIIVAIVRVILYIVLFMFFEPNIAYVGVVSLVIALLTMSIQRHYTRILLPFMKINRSYFDWNAIKEVVSSGVWNSVNQIGVTLLSTIGLMMCNKLYGATAGGDYSIALTIPQFLNGIVSMLSSVFLPGLTIKYAKGDKKEIIQHVNAAQSIIGLMVNIPVAMFMAVGTNFFRLWTPTVDSGHLQILSVLSIGYLLVTGVAWPISNLNTVMNKVKIPAIVMVGTGVINAVSIYLTYRYTNLGLYSIPLGQMILFILNRTIFVGIYSAHNLGEKWYVFYTALGKGLIIALVTYSISYVVNRLYNPITWLGLIAECVILAILLLPTSAYIMYGRKAFSEIVAFLKVKFHK